MGSDPGSVRLFRLGCGAGQRRRPAARHAHLSDRAEEIRLPVPRPVPLPGRTLRPARLGEEVPAPPASVSRHRLRLTAMS